MEWFGLVHHIRAKEGSDFGLAGLGSGRFGLLRGEFFFSSSYHERNECVDGLIFFFLPHLSCLEGGIRGF